ncbi:hypothetical protein [Erythrobacter rubeus]|uniref:hypothetical protein n=1 Tax=Erythrobacter rubeus TaxID=2760803 RepID=UPI002E2DDAFF|nr:hypothetical protein [Erythrobacter rubeus]
MATSGAALGLALVALSACSEPPGAAPGAVTESEARALEDAAEMLDERRYPESDAAEQKTAELTGDSAE